MVAIPEAAKDVSTFGTAKKKEREREMCDKERRG